jgi:hypothetical protein
MAKTDRRVDAYIEKAKPFAQPILRHIRACVHAGCPDVEETIKWRFPSFYYKGPLCNMAAFTTHATFGFWKHTLLADRLPRTDRRAMGQFGRLAAVSDLPGRARLVRLVKAAAKLNDDGVKVVRPRASKPRVKVPPFFMAALRKNARALATFQAFPPGHKREYVEFVTEAKRDETRARRMATTVAWLASGKSRNWKYEKKT